jgi:hypothetical protein
MIIRDDAADGSLGMGVACTFPDPERYCPPVDRIDTDRTIHSDEKT